MSTKTKEQFVETINRVNPYAPYMKVVSEYNGVKKDVEVECLICHKRFVIKAGYAKTWRCHDCSIEMGLIQEHGFTHEQFVKMVQENNPYADTIIFRSRYQNNKVKVKCECKTCGNVWETSGYQLTHMKQACPKCGIKKCTDASRFTRDEIIQKLIDCDAQAELIGDYVDTHTPTEFLCLKCGNEYKTSPSTILYNKHNSNGCPYCSNHMIIFGYNDVWSTHPEFVKHFKNPEESKSITMRNCRRIMFVCADCGYERYASPQDVFRVLGDDEYYFYCTCCSDNISIPNKFIRGLLKQLPVENIIYEYSPEWAGRYKYDAYFIYNNQQYIVEMDGGLGHGKKAFHQKSDKLGLKRDIIKNNLADEHGINLIRIDCDTGELVKIREKTEHSQLSDIFDLSEIDWIEVYKSCAKNDIKDICADYKSGVAIKDLCVKYEYTRETLLKYLEMGAQYGWCDYVKVDYNWGSKRVIAYNPKMEYKGVFISYVDCVRYIKNKLGILISTRFKRYIDTNKPFKGFYFYSDESKINTDITAQK